MRTLYIALLAAALVAGCKKDDDEPAPAPVAPTGHTVEVTVNTIGDYRLHTTLTNASTFNGWVNGDTTILYTAYSGNTVWAEVSEGQSTTTLRIKVDGVQVFVEGAVADITHDGEYTLP